LDVITTILVSTPVCSPGHGVLPCVTPLSISHLGLGSEGGYRLWEHTIILSYSPRRYSPPSLLALLAPLDSADTQMNPHFAFSAIFALGLRGIANKSKLPYGPINSPGVTRETLIKLPTSLESATAQFKREGSLAREVMGDYFVDHFAGTREHELEVFRKAVTDWEGGSFFFYTWSPRSLLPATYT